MVRGPARWVLGSAAVVIALLALAGCGSSRSVAKNEIAIAAPVGKGTERFSAPGMALHFRYPSTFKVRQPPTPVEQAGTAKNTRRALLQLGTSVNELFVSDFSGLNVPVTPQNASALEADFDQPITQLAGHRLPITVRTVGGHVIFQWPRFPAPQLGTGVTQQISNIFIGDSEYEINCEAEPNGLARVKAACAEALSTVTG